LAKKITVSRQSKKEMRNIIGFPFVIIIDNFHRPFQKQVPDTSKNINK